MGDVEDNGPWLDKYHAMNPDRPLGVSEYGSEAVLKWHTTTPDNHDYTEKYAADARDEGGVQGRNKK
ncbi:MAG: hypothetical protein ACI4TF_15345 [Oliverpabstia sp.]